MADCKYPGCEGDTYIGPVCKDHYEEFQGSGFAGDINDWLESEGTSEEEEPEDIKEKGTCAYEGCSRTCGSDEFCHGCKAHICEEHSINFNTPIGPHSTESHFEEDIDE